jgi:hypothetical protein
MRENLKTGDLNNAQWNKTGGSTVVDNLGQIQVKRKFGRESFHADGSNLSFSLLDFWQWSGSDIVSNVTRGVLAEYIVACALGIDTRGAREEWAAYDLQLPSGIKIEVKSAAFIQSWSQKQYSSIIFKTPKTQAWARETNEFSVETKRQADLYIFALLHHKEKATIDPLDVNQWKFYVLRTSDINARKRSQHSMTLKTLCGLCESSSYFELPEAVQKITAQMIL